MVTGDRRLHRLLALPAALMLLPPLAGTAGKEGVLVRICTAGSVKYIRLPTDDDNDTDGSHQACHAPCLCSRKRSGEPNPTDEDD
jgi:hypothetical protein